MKTCKKCKKVYPDNMAFCPECGEKLVVEGECPKCHKEVAKDEQFCPFCGEKLNEAEEVKQEVVDKKGRKYTDEQLKRYRSQIDSFKSSRLHFHIGGGLCLGFGLLGIVIGIIIVCSVFYRNDPLSYGLITLGTTLYSLAIVLATVGICFLVVGSAVFSKRIENRERILKEYDK